jgi:GMP reductase
MDTVGTFEVYNVLKQHKIITAMHKFYSLQDFQNAHKKYGLDPDYFMVSTGIGYNAIENLEEILSVIDCKWICIDIANGYIQKLVSFCRSVREKFPDKIIVAGNVVSREMTEELILYQ